MNKILFGLFLASCFSLQAQDKSPEPAEKSNYSIGISNYQSINFRTLSTTNNNGITRAIRNDVDENRYRSSYGIHLSKKVNEHITISTSLLYSRIGFQTKIVAFNLEEFSPTDYYYEEERRQFSFQDQEIEYMYGFAYVDYLDNSDYRYVFDTQHSPAKQRNMQLIFNYDYLEIPVDVSFTTPKSWLNISPYYKLGMSVGYLLEQDVVGVIEDIEADEKINTRYISNVKPEIENGAYRFYNFSVRNAIGLSYPINEKMQFLTEFRFNYYLSDFQKYDNVKEHLYNYGVNMILSYSINK